MRKQQSMKLTNRKRGGIAIYFLFFLLVMNAYPNDLQYGLKFCAYSYEPERRTSFDLFPDGFESFSEGFSLSFDVKFEFKEVQTYGYIFRITDKNSNKMDFLLGEKVIFFSSSLGDIIFSRTFNEVKLFPGQWMKVRLDVNIKKDELRLSIGDIVSSWKVQGVESFKNVRIVFGKNNYLETQAVDVPNMTIKDIKIEDRDKSLYYWKLSRFTTNGVYDELKNQFAKCENPDWILTQSATWKRENTFACEGNPYIAYNPHKNIVAVADQHLFYSFMLNEKQLDKQAIAREFSYPRYANQMIYNPADSNYYSYNLVKEGVGREFAVFDQKAKSWAKTTLHNHYSDYWHHNRYFSVNNNILYLFGGYGHHKYKKDVFMYNVSNKVWSREALKGDSVEPRYLSGLGIINETQLLRFGGYGSKSGNQDLSPQHYYDAYLIDIKTMEAKKLWTLETPSENFVVSNSLIVDTTNNCFYALCYPFTKFNTAIMLYKFSMTEPKYEVLADTIPLRFKDAGSFVDLFLDKVNQKLVAVTSSSIAFDSLASISIYSLSYPPLKKNDLYQPIKSKNKIFGIILIAGVIGLVIFFILYFYRRRNMKRENIQRNKDAGVTKTDNSIESVSGISTVKSVRKQAILLFGGFQVIDKDGKNLTTEFTPIIKNLFLLVLLNTIKNGKGVSFLKLKEILWFDMTDESANNNRGVAMSKIRQIMKQVGDVQFIKQGMYWTIEFGNDLYCDYYDALILIQKIKKNKEKNVDDIVRLLSIVSEGELLPNMQIDWADIFKSDFSNDLVDLIMELINQKETKFSDPLYIDMANAIFIHDPLNEDALRLKCSILVKMGKNGLAKNTYTAFVKEYTAWFASDYKYSFDQIIS